jgi:cytochrome c-type biogenesis protein CcmF
MAFLASLAGVGTLFRRGSKQSVLIFQIAALGYTFGILLSFLTMVWALLLHIFGVKYVSMVGSLVTPPLYSVVSLWSSLEGSILLWMLILGFYLTCFVVLERRQAYEDACYGTTIGVTLMVSAFFACICLGPADPFVLLNPAPLDGPGPNPLLQNHPLMIIHPPVLYMGYVGMTLPFALVAAVLMEGKWTRYWQKALRRWMLVAWGFLSVGIILGGWWAYEVLGWGGYWAWDPVENASFIPWLAATGYLHAGVAMERKRVLTQWALIQAMLAFWLTILGTFMTRSGIFNSVHSFTQSAIGPMFLAFLMGLMIFSIVLLLMRGHLFRDEGQTRSALTREAVFVVNNLLLLVLTFTILLGTIYPLLAEAFSGVKLSVGEPYFNKMTLPFGLGLVFFMGVGPRLPWGSGNLVEIRKALYGPCIAGAVVCLCAYFFQVHQPLVLLTVFLLGFACVSTLAMLQEHAGGRRMPTARQLGGSIIHLGILLIALGMCISQNYRTTREGLLRKGESLDLNHYRFTYNGPQTEVEAHRFSIWANILVTPLEQKNGHLSSWFMRPRLNFYPNQREPIATPQVVTHGITDVYLSLLSMENKGHEIVLKAYTIPGVLLLWQSIPILIAGTLLTLWPKRKFLSKTS